MSNTATAAARYRIESPIAGTTVVTIVREVSCTQVIVREVTSGFEFMIEERLLFPCKSLRK